MACAARTKRDMDGDDSSKNELNNGRVINDEAVQSAVDDMKLQFMQRLQPLKDDASYAINKCQQIHAANMVKIPRNVKNMTIEEFDAVYHCDLLNLMKGIRSNYSQSSHPPSTKQMRHQQLVSETPEMSGRARGRLQTPSRTVRKGREPGKGDLVATVTKKKRSVAGRPGSGIHPQTEMGISIGDGTIVPLTDEECIKDLDSEAKSNALDQVIILQEQLAKIVSLLQN